MYILAFLRIKINGILSIIPRLLKRFLLFEHIVAILFEVCRKSEH